MWLSCGCRRVWINSTRSRGGIGPSNRRAIVELRSRPVDRDTPGNPIKTGSLALPGPIRAGLTPWPEGPAATTMHTDSVYSSSHAWRQIATRWHQGNMAAIPSVADLEATSRITSTSVLGRVTESTFACRDCNLRTRQKRSQGHEGDQGSGSEGSPRVAAPPVHRSPGQPSTTRP